MTRRPLMGVVVSRPLPPAAIVADRLHRIARRVELLGIAGRVTPEDVVIEELTLAGELRKLAQEAQP